LRVDHKIRIPKLWLENGSYSYINSHVIVVDVCFPHLYSLIDLLSIFNSFFVNMNFYDAKYRLLCAL
jgi:hypothetical protein